MLFRAVVTGIYRAARHAAARAQSCRFARAQDGVAAVEFGLVAAPFLALLFAIMETAFVFFASQSLEAAVAQAGRLIMTGQAFNAGYTQTTFKNAICATMANMFNCKDKLFVSVENYTKFADAGTTPPYDSNGQLKTSNLPYHPGEPGEVIVVSFYYQWPIYVSMFSNNLSNQNGGNRLMVATSVFRNEPYK
jgi:Flp pilus assembly protein TadG